MQRGLANEIRNLQQAKRNGQYSMFDYWSTENLLDSYPCAFDSIREIVLDDFTMVEQGNEYDPDAAMEEATP